MLIEILVLSSEIVRTFDISCQCYLTWLGWILHCDRWSVVNHTSLISFTWCNYIEREPESNVGAFRQKDIFNFQYKCFDWCNNIFWNFFSISQVHSNWPIKWHCCPHKETSQLICTANRLTAFYLRATLALNGLNMNELIEEELINLRYECDAC